MHFYSHPPDIVASGDNVVGRLFGVKFWIYVIMNTGDDEHTVEKRLRE
jgi:hypothetical protein